tara:strand:- start:4184 stop:6070 length:1887 start_codon:yes stop_codon:yes gene_type:complete
MCGFVSVIDPKNKLSLSDLIVMRDTLAHRGPDGADHWKGEYNNKSIMMGFRRLAIIDTREIANQPMKIGNYVINFNGEIYNYVELKKTLISLGRSFKTNSDTEVLLQSFQQWGEAMIPKINGMFSFTIWDEIKKILFVCRDRLGEKPLFFSRIKYGSLIFSSEIKAILAHPEISSTFNLDIFDDILLQKEYIFGSDKTLFKNVEQFPAATFMKFNLDGELIKKEKYWQPSYDFSSEDIYSTENKLFDQLKNSINLRVRSDVPITAALSGGLDSSILVSLLSNKSNNLGIKIDNTISVRFPDDETIDEGFYIDKLIKKVDIKNTVITPEPESLIKDVRKMHWHHETIIPGISMFLEWSVMKLVKSLNYKVIIDGQGADELFAGYDSYLQAYQVSKAHPKNGFKGLYESIKLGKIRNARLRNLSSKYKDFKRRSTISPGLNLKGIINFYRARKEEYQKLNLLNKVSGKKFDFFQFELAYQLTKISLPSNLYSGDRNSMAHGIECRYPYLDYDLLDFSMMIPKKYFIFDGWSKYILRKTFENYLPKEISWRIDKVGFQAPEDEWIKNKVFLNWIKERIFDNNLKLINNYRRKDMVEYLDQHLEGINNNASILWLWASASELIDMKRCGYWN